MPEANAERIGDRRDARRRACPPCRAGASLPHGEHDFGAFDYAARRVFWKIDYLAKGFAAQGSEHPEDPDRTDRVLTILFAEGW